MEQMDNQSIISKESIIAKQAVNEEILLYAERGAEDDVSVGSASVAGASVYSTNSAATIISQASQYSHVFVRAGGIGRKIAAEIALQNLCIEWKSTGSMSIFEACRRNNVARVQEILEQCPAAVDMLDFGGNTPAQIACMVRSHEVTKLLIEQGAEILKPDPIGIPALAYVKETVVRVQLQRIADAFTKDDVDYLDDDSTIAGDTNVTRDAAYRGDMIMLDNLLQANPSLLYSKDKKGHTPLIFACMGQQADCAMYLLERGADLYAETTYGWQALRFVNDKVKRDKISNFAFKVSPLGRQQAALAMQKRKNEARFALHQCTMSVMDNIRSVILTREERLRLRAEVLSEFCLRKADDYLVVGSLRAVEHFIRLFMDEQDRLAEEEARRLAWEEEERIRQREEFIAENIRQIMAQRAALEAERAEKERLRQLAEEEAERLRMRLEIAARIKKQKQDALIEEEIARAELSWSAMEAEKRAEARMKFQKTRPLRMKLLRRMLKSAGEGTGAHVPDPDDWLREERALEIRYKTSLKFDSVRRRAGGTGLGLGLG